MFLIGNVLKPLAEIISVPSGLTAAASATDAAIQKNVFGSGTTLLIFSNEKLNDIMKIITSLEDSGLLIKGINKKVENEVKQQKGGFLGILAAILSANLLGSTLARHRVVRSGDGVVRVGG